MFMCIIDGAATPLSSVRWDASGKLTLPVPTVRSENGQHVKSMNSKTQTWMRTCGWVAALSLGHADLRAQTVINGSFESGVPIFPNSNIGLYSPDSTSVTGWTVAGGTVDYIGSLWAAGDGNRSLDLSGVSAGTLTQLINGFILGGTYRLEFLLAGNPSGGGDIKSVVASLGANSQTFSINRTGATFDSMGWTSQGFDFTADATSLALSFTSLDPTASGPALDLVRIYPTPEPGTLTLAALGALAAMAGWLVCRRADGRPPAVW